MRYDRLMALGWKLLIPFGLIWALVTGAVVVLPQRYSRQTILIGAAVITGVLLLVSIIWPLFAPKPQDPQDSHQGAST